MNRRNWLTTLLTLAMLAGAGMSAAQQPPADLHLEGDHWTAWSPPATAPEGIQVYIVKPGDSLWEIAATMLGDPHLWPQIWEQNQYILDAHWIYPGDPLFVIGAAAPGAFADADGVAGAPLGEAAAGAPMADSGSGADDPFNTVLDGAEEPKQTLGFTGREHFVNPEGPVPLGYESDIYCTGFIGDLDEEFAYQIAASEYEYLTPSLEPGSNSVIRGIHGTASTEKYGLGAGDIVYIDGGRADGLSAGELLTAVQASEEVFHPKSRELLGRLYKYLGRIRVLSAQQETAIAEIVQLCSPIPVGTSLKLFEPEPVPLRKTTPLRPVNFPPADQDLDSAPTIVIAWDKLLSLGAGYLVFIDHGDGQEVAPGDIYTIYRRGREGFPPTLLGELAVLSVFDNTALARILRSRYTVFVGDALYLK
ncbi:MAG: LysM peptidoglycan-binding domain-containing protein [bacterium]|nr:LysM peptidoglycan-binding domain-containing protein [bacterium]